MLRILILSLSALILLSSNLHAQNFMGYPCTDDCSGHEAGYNWAENKGIESPDDCGGNSSSFIEGCKAYAEEQENENEQENESDESSESSDDY